MMKTLIMVDIQNDFLPSGALPVPGGDTIIPVVNKLQGCFDLIIATQDWHPANHKSFASGHPGKKPFEIIDLDGLQQTLWPDHCIQGSHGAAFAAQLNMNNAEAIFRKGTNAETDSYSGFYDNGHRKSTGMSGYLHDKKANEVYICGLAGDICVLYTAMDSLAEKFTTYIIRDAAPPLNPDLFQKVLEDFSAKGGNIVSSSEILRRKIT